MTHEKSLIGCLLREAAKSESDNLIEVIELIKPEYFSEKALEIAYRGILEDFNANVPVDILNLSERLTGANPDFHFLGILNECYNAMHSTKNTMLYAANVKEAFTKKKIREIGFAIEDDLNCGKGSVEILDSINRSLVNLEDFEEKKGTLLSEYIPEFVRDLEEAAENGTEIRGLTTGWPDLDESMKGANSGDLIIIAGRPSMGKSIALENILSHAALTEKKPVINFSLEMSVGELMNRIVANRGDVNLSDVKSGRIAHDDLAFAAMTNVVQQIKESRYMIDDTGSLTISQLRARAMTFARRNGGVAAIGVDYLQLIQAPGDKNQNRTNEISEISRQLKALAKDLKCPVFALSQLNRSVENRACKRPVMADLRESGQIEQDADHIYFVYRDEVYNEKTVAKNCVEMIHAKGRGTGLKSVVGIFDGAKQKFRQADHSAYDLVEQSKNCKSQSKQKFSL